MVTLDIPIGIFLWSLITHMVDHNPYPFLILLGIFGIYIFYFKIYVKLPYHRLPLELQGLLHIIYIMSVVFLMNSYLIQTIEAMTKTSMILISNIQDSIFSPEFRSNHNPLLN
jgi:hypothetical protein